MENLTTYAAFAEIFGAIAIFGGGLFGLVQLNEYRKRRRYQIAADLCRSIADPDLARAIVLLKSLPDGLSLKEFQERDSCYEEAAQVVGLTFETMGILVQKEIASFRIVQELAGGLILMLWRKVALQIEETRVEQNNPRFGEWYQWLVERLQEQESSIEPAFIAYAKSNKQLRW